LQLPEDFVVFLEEIRSKYSPDVLLPIEKKGMAIVKYVNFVRPEILKGLTISPAAIYHNRVVYFDPTHLPLRKVLVFDDAVFSGRTMSTTKGLVVRYASAVNTAAYWVSTESSKLIQVDSYRHKLDLADLLEGYFSYLTLISRFRLTTINDNPTIVLRIVPPLPLNQMRQLMELQAFAETRELGSGIKLEVYEKLFQRGGGIDLREYVIQAYYDPSGQLTLCVERFTDEPDNISSSSRLSTLDREWLDFIEIEITQLKQRLNNLLSKLGATIELMEIDLEGIRRRNKHYLNTLRQREKRLRQLLRRSAYDVT